MLAGPGAWTTDDSDDDYSPAEFYTRSVDDRGHSALSSRIRLRPEIGNELSALVARQTVPAYRTPQDFIRDAIVHRLHYIADLETDPAFRERVHSQVQRITMEEITVAYEAELDLVHNLIGQIKAVAEKALRIRDTEALKVFLRGMRERGASMREPFRSTLLAEITLMEGRIEAHERGEDNPE